MLWHWHISTTAIEEHLHLRSAEAVTAADVGLGRCAEGYLEDVEGLAQVVHVLGFGSLAFHSEEGG